MWSPQKGSFLGDFVYRFVYLITSGNSVQQHHICSLCAPLSLMSVEGILSGGTTCFSRGTPSGPEDSWNAAVSLKGNQDLDQGT